MKNSERIKLGGEFEINPNILSEFFDYKPKGDIFLYSSGASALMAILKHISKGKTKVIHLPYYTCHSVVTACLNVGYHVNFYEPTECFLFPLDYINKIKKGEVLLTVNYFGFVDDNHVIRDIKSSRSDITIISDQVQSFWTYDKTEADYSFTSLRKHFPIPGGAIVYCKNSTITHDIHLNKATFIEKKLIGSFLKYLQLPDKVYLNFFEEGEKEIINESEISKASALVYYLFEKLNLAEAKEKRKTNCRLVYELGNLHGFNFVFPFTEDVVPLNVPIIIKDRDNVRKKLMGKNVFLPVHWPTEAFNSSSAIAKRMSSHELSLVIDQRYSVNEIEHQLQSLFNEINHG